MNKYDMPCNRCTAPDTPCPYWEGTFCSKDVEEEPPSLSLENYLIKHKD